jgi:hypothetical protein
MSCRDAYVLDQHEALGVRNDLRRVQSLLKVVDESRLVFGRGGVRSVKETGSTATLSLERTQAASENSLTDQSDGHTEVQRVDGGPLSGTLLTSGVQNLLNDSCAILVVLVHDIAGDFDEEGVEDALVPLGEDISDLLVAHGETTLHDIVRLSLVS